MEGQRYQQLGGKHLSKTSTVSFSICLLTSELMDLLVVL